MLRFTFKEAPVTIKNVKQANPQAIGEELSRLAEENNGKLTPENTWEAARNRPNPLHRHIEWREDVAAKAYQLDQCRELIRIVRVIDDEVADDEIKRAFVSISEGRNGTSYRAIAEVLDDRQLQLAVLRQAEKDLAAWEKRYSELTDICSMVRTARMRLIAMRDRDDRDHDSDGPEARPQ